MCEGISSIVFLSPFPSESRALAGPKEVLRDLLGPSGLACVLSLSSLQKVRDSWWRLFARRTQEDGIGDRLRWGIARNAGEETSEREEQAEAWGMPWGSPIAKAA
jgi:hypothetical protein